MDIRKATQQDVSTIADFQVQMAYESERMELELNTVQKGISTLIENPDWGYYLVAEREQTPLACLMVLYEWSDWRCKKVLWIHSVYVHPNHRRKGVYRSMYEYLREHVRDNKEFAAIRLYVDKTNSNAIKTYEELGMSRDHYDLFESLE